MKENTVNNIILFSPLPPPEGGLSSWTIDYLEYAKQRNIDVHIIDNSLVGKSSVQHEGRNIFDEIKRIQKIRRSIKLKKSIDDNSIIHYNTSCSFFGLIRDYCFFLKHFKNKKVVMQCHCDVSLYIRNKTHLKLFRKISRMCQIVLVLNDQSLEFLKSNGILNGRLFPNFIKTSNIKPKVNAVSDIKNIAFVGHVRKEKGFDIIESCANRYKNLVFHIFGQIPEGFRKPENTNIIFYGSLKKEILFSKLREMDALMAPSFAEGFSVSLLECLFIGMIIISSPAGFATSLLKGTKNIVTKDYESRSFISAMETLLSYEKCTLQNLSKTNSKIGALYDVECILDKLFKIYEKIYLRNY